jgi:hypothetical protein
MTGCGVRSLSRRIFADAVIQDLQLNARGMVEYSMGISLLKPVDLTKGNRALLYETVNRGTGSSNGRATRSPGADGKATSRPASEYRCRSLSTRTALQLPVACAPNMSP